MKAREYCCCAIPLVNAGIYLTLIEHIVVSLLVGILAVATPSIVGTSTPSFASWILAIICFVITAVQSLGVIGVAKEKTISYRRYVTLHGLAISAAFAVAAAWIIVSAARHSNAEAKCIQDFFSPSGSASNSSEGTTLCNIFPWVDVGIMGALWVLLAILQLYLFVIISSYGAGQRWDHKQYDRIYDMNQPLTHNIPLDIHAGPGDLSTQYGHLRNESVESTSGIMSHPPQKPDSHDYPYNDNPVMRA